MVRNGALFRASAEASQWNTTNGTRFVQRLTLRIPDCRADDSTDYYRYYTGGEARDSYLKKRKSNLKNGHQRISTSWEKGHFALCPLFLNDPVESQDNGDQSPQLFPTRIFECVLFVLDIESNILVIVYCVMSVF